MQEYLKKCSEAYYNGKPLITDMQFDLLVDKFGFNEVGAKPAGKTGKHVHQMFSLQKHYEGEGKSPLADIPDSEKVRSPKLDGAAISILYVDGKLSRVLTRGDGVEGQDITAKFLATSVIPHKIRLSGVVQVIGEIVAPKEIENARNYAAGALNLKDVNEFKTRAISFFAYGIYPYMSSSFSEDMIILKRLGFETVFAKNLTEVYDCDGIVFRVDNYSEYDRMGRTSKFPKGAFALKTKGEAVETTLLSVEWGVGKSGKVTPVGILEPVLVGDAMVSRVTLNNQAFIEMLELTIGCTVGIQRAGEIIPQVLYKVD